MVDPPPGGRAPALAAPQPAVRVQRRPVLWLAAVWAAVLGLLYLALRGTPVTDILAVLGRLHGWQVLLLALANGLILLLIAARWWVVLHSLGGHVPISVLVLYRLAGFSVSYFTPGPHFGGEPLQVHLLHDRRGMALPTAVSGVLLERLIDLLANFTFLVTGLLIVVLTGVVKNLAWAPASFLLVVPLLFPLVHLAALWSGRRPVGWLLGKLAHRWSRWDRLAQVVLQAEEQIGTAFRSRPLALLAAVGISAVIWAATIFEYWLTLRFFGVEPDLRETISALTAARLSILLPLPGALGALEAGQALATQLLGWGPALGIAVSLVIRVRDVLLGLIGLLVGGLVYRSALFGEFSKGRSS